MAGRDSTDPIFAAAGLPADLRAALAAESPDAATWAAATDRLATYLAACLPFVPDPARTRHLADPAAGPIPALRLSGSVLCADVSGFTALSSALAHGRAGSEQISALMNRLFAALVEAVTAHGGTVVQFGGDALTALFDAQRLGAEHAAQAAAAALRMQEAMADFAAVPTPDAPMPLQLRVALDSGELFATEAGTAEHREWIVTGPVLHRVVVAQESAAPGAVVLSALARQAVPGAAVTALGPDLWRLDAIREPPAPASPAAGWVPGPPGPDTVAALLARIQAVAPFVPYGLPDRFLQAGATIGEFRPVTVLFADFYPLADLLARLDAAATPTEFAAVGGLLDRTYTAVQRVVHTFGGIVNKVDMAASGNRVLALFGAPTAHEDDPQRAVEAALGLAALAAEADLPAAPRISLATGTVFAGIVGPPARHEYTVMGRTVNLAARVLSVAAPGETLLTSRVRRAVERRLAVEPRPPMRAKGIPDPVPLFRAAGMRPTMPLRRAWAPLVGRDAELADLQDVGRQALTPGPGAGGLVAISGPAGVGKTRLAAEAVRTLRMRPGLLVLEEPCQSYEETVPYAVIGRVLRRLVLPDLALDPVQALAGYLADLVPAWSRFGPLLHPLLGLPPADTPLTRALDAQTRRARLADLVRALLTALADRRPLLLLLDDWQWADASSRALVEALIGDLPGHALLLLLTYRPLSSAPAWQDLPMTYTLDLSPLDPSASTALLTHLLGGSVPPQLAALTEQAGGLPFLLEESVRYLLDAGALKRDAAGDWFYLRDDDAAPLSARIDSIITARLDRLDEPTRLLAQVAAVLGQRVPRRLLEAVVPPGVPLEAGLAALAEAALLVPEDETDEPAYRFAQVVTRDVVYNSLLFARRRELHTQAAEAIERLYATDLESYRVALAEHYRQAGRTAEAFAHYLAAAVAAQARYAVAEALRLYEQTLTVAPWIEDPHSPLGAAMAATFHENRGDLLALTGDYPGARDHYEALLRLLAGDSDPLMTVRRATLQRKIGNTYEANGDLDTALTSLAQAAAGLDSAPPVPATYLEQAQIFSDTGWVYFRRGDLDQAARNLQEALALVPGVEEVRAPILNRLAGIAWNRGDLVHAGIYVERYLASSRESGNLVNEAKALSNLALLAQNQDRLKAAARSSLAALDLHEQTGNRAMAAQVAGNLGYVYYLAADYPAARESLNQAVEWARSIAATGSVRLILLNLGRVLTELGQWEAAEEALYQSLALAQEHDLPLEMLDTQVALGELALKQGDWPGVTAAQQAAAALATDPQVEEYGRYLRLEARLAKAGGRLSEAADLLGQAAAVFQQVQNLAEIRRTRALGTAWALPGY